MIRKVVSLGAIVLLIQGLVSSDPMTSITMYGEPINGPFMLGTPFALMCKAYYIFTNENGTTYGYHVNYYYKASSTATAIKIGYYLGENNGVPLIEFKSTNHSVLAAMSVQKGNIISFPRYEIMINPKTINSKGIYYCGFEAQRVKDGASDKEYRSEVHIK